MATPKRKLFARVDEHTHERIQLEAERRFQGNDSMVVREAIDTYLDLREQLGPRYDIVIATLRGDRDPVAVPA